MSAILLAVVVCFVAGTAEADPTGSDIRCSADTTLSFTTGLKTNGPRFVDLAGDGSAAIKFIWFKDDNTARNAGAISRSLLVYLRDYAGPRGFFFASGPDSADVDLSSASEVIVTK
jgi:hypothetical protein